jgi:hypothetical protein
VLCLIVVPLIPGKNVFAVQLNNNNTLDDNAVWTETGYVHNFRSNILPHSSGKNISCYIFFSHIHSMQLWKRDSAVGIATGYRLDDRGFEFRVSVLARFCLVHNVQSGSGVSFLGSKAVGT